MSLTRTAAKGAMWSFVDVIFNKAAQFLGTLVLARILGPEEFGIIGMIVLFINIGNSLVDSGMSTSLLRMKSPDETDYSTVFVANMAISILVYLIIFLIAPLIAAFYEEVILTSVIRIYGLGFILGAIKAVRVIRLTKALDFRRIAMFNVPGVVLSIVVAIWMANNNWGVYSLVGMFLVNQTVSAIIYGLLVKENVRLKFSFERWKFHFRFGYKLTLSTQLNIVFENIYNVIIGKFYSTKSLGFYERAQAFNAYPAQVVLTVLSKVALPSFALIKDDLERVRDGYRKVIGISFFGMCIIMCITGALAKPLFLLVLGEQWLPAIPYFRILILAYILYPVHSLNISLLSLFDRSDLFLKIEIYKKLVASLALSLGYFYDIEGFLWSIVVSSFIGLAINTFYSKKLINYSFLNQLTDLAPVFVIMGLVYITIYMVSTYLVMSPLATLVILGPGALLMIWALSLLTKLEVYLSLKVLALNFIKR